MFKEIKKLKIKIASNNLKKDFFLIDINKENKIKLKKIFNYNKIPFSEKMGFVVLSKIYFLDSLKIFFYIKNINNNFNENINFYIIDTIFNINKNTYLLDNNYINLENIDFDFKFKFSLYVLIKQIENMDKDVKIDFKLEKGLTILFNDNYNRLIREFIIEDDEDIIKNFKIFNFDDVKISKIIYERIFDQIKNDLLDGYSITLNDFEFEILHYKPNSDALCVQLTNVKSGKKIIIYPITFDPNTGLLTQVGEDMNQLRLI